MNRIGLTRRLLVLILSIVACGCVCNDFATDASERVKAADWSQMQTVTVSLQDYAFQPSDLVFELNTPYKLQIANDGTRKHYFTAVDFFKSIATRKVQSNTDGEIKAPYFSALEVFPGRSLDLYFIPAKTGKYDLDCTIKGHREAGMHGVIEIR